VGENISENKGMGNKKTVGGTKREVALETFMVLWGGTGRRAKERGLEGRRK